MLLDLTDIQASEKPESKPFKPGKYLLKVTEAAVKPTKAGGKMITMVLKIVGGEGEWKPFEGWRTNTSFNIEHKNPDVVNIGKQQLKEFMVYSGMDNFILDKASDLIGKSAFAKVATRTFDGKEYLDVKYFISPTDSSAEESTDLF